MTAAALRFAASTQLWRSDVLAAGGDRWSTHRVLPKRSIDADQRRADLCLDRGTLYHHLRQRHRRRGRRKPRPSLRTRRDPRLDISQRPEVVDERGRFGDWEGDTVLGTGRAAISTHVERCSGYVVAFKQPNRESIPLAQATVAAFSGFPSDLRRTMTYDNGAEFSAFEHIEQRSGFRVFFARPHAHWQRGCNENANGLLRQFFPKGRSLDAISQAELDKTVELLNHRPRKRLGYKTPHEVLTQNRFVAIGT